MQQERFYVMANDKVLLSAFIRRAVCIGWISDTPPRYKDVEGLDNLGNHSLHLYVNNYAYPVNFSFTANIPIFKLSSEKPTTRLKKFTLPEDWYAATEALHKLYDGYLSHIKAEADAKEAARLKEEEDSIEDDTVDAEVSYIPKEKKSVPKSTGIVISVDGTLCISLSHLAQYHNVKLENIVVTV